MKLSLIGCFALLTCWVAQSPDYQARHAGYMERATVSHLAHSVEVSANSPRPLAQAITALSEEYAWLIDFEDPPYSSKYDLVDDTAPAWRAAHPAAKGVTSIAGGSFKTELLEIPVADAPPAEEEHILDGLVSDYNATTNPGRFAVRSEGNGRFAIIGTGMKGDDGEFQTVKPLLDTPISVQTGTRDGLTTIHIILKELTAKSGTKVFAGLLALNALHQTEVTVGGENIPARSLLIQTLSAAKLRLYWRLYYDHDVKSYAFSVLPLMKAEYDTSGNRTLVFAH